MNLSIHSTAGQATKAAADHLASLLLQPSTRTLLAAGGNSPLALYQEIAARTLPLPNLTVFALDEYVGVPEQDPRTCANLLRRTVAEAWGISADRYFWVRAQPEAALASVQEHERRIAAQGGLDVLILGLGLNGHLGYNEPGSEPDSPGRVVDLAPTSIESNRQWFKGDYAPDRGAAVGLKAILAGKHILILAFGEAKAEAVVKMVEGPQQKNFPAAWLQSHPDTRVFLDQAAASRLSSLPCP